MSTVTYVERISTGNGKSRRGIEVTLPLFCVFFFCNFTLLAQITREIYAFVLNDPLYACNVKHLKYCSFKTNKKCFENRPMKRLVFR